MPMNRLGNKLYNSKSLKCNHVTGPYGRQGIFFTNHATHVRYRDSLPFLISHRFPSRYQHIIVAEDEQKQDLVDSSQPRSVGARKGSAGDLRQSLKLASLVEESMGEVTIGPVRIFHSHFWLKTSLQETYDESVRSGMKAAAFASTEFVQQRILEHEKVLVRLCDPSFQSSWV